MSLFEKGDKYLLGISSSVVSIRMDMKQSKEIEREDLEETQNEART